VQHFHEAGHVVARWVLLKDCHTVEINADGSGATYWATTDVVTERDRCEAEIVICMGVFLEGSRNIIAHAN
jgi:hypothetical protein